MSSQTISCVPKTARAMGIMCGFPPPPEKRPTLDNWDLAPFNRWSFQNMRQLFPTVDVPRGANAPSPFVQDEQDLTGITFKCHDGRCLAIGDWIQESYTDGILVMHRGKVLTEHYANGMTLETPHLGQSVSKSLVGALAGIIHDEGLLDLAAPLTEYVPEFNECGYKGCTVDQALDMQSGVRFVEDYGVPDSDMTRVDIASGWRPTRNGEIQPTIRDVMLSLKQERPHGEKFTYRSIETDAVAWVLERAAKQDLATLLSDRIWQHLGCERDGFFTVDGAGVALADGGFSATLRDYTRFGQMILNNGRVGNRQVVPTEWIERFSSGADSSKFGEPYSDLSPKGAYRRFWWIREACPTAIMARGVFGQLIFVDPAKDFLLVKNSSWPDYLITSYSHDAIGAAEAIAAKVSS